MRFSILMTMLLLMMTISLQSEAVRDFTLPDMNNQNVTLSSFLDKGPVILDFWASWCAPCMRLLPELEKIHAEYDNVTVVAVNIDNPRSVNRAKSHIRSQKHTFVTLFDTNQEVMKQFQVTSIPHTFLLNENGVIVYEHTGYTRGDEEELREEVEKLLGLTEEETAAEPEVD